MEIEASYVCATCLQLNTIAVDPGGGPLQEYVEDCQVCCRPNALTIVVDAGAWTAEATAELP